MPVTHEPWLVALSLIVAIQGSYVGLSLAVQVGEAVGVRRRALLAGAAISLAVAIWAMHFVGMLAARLPFPVDYLVLPTLLSFLICVIVVGTAVFHRQRRAFDAVAPRRLRLPDGQRHRDDALHRHGSAACECSHAARSALRRVEHGRRHRRVRPGALAGHRPGAPAAAHPVGDRLRRGHLRDALHRHGRADAVPARRPVVGRPRAVQRSPRHRRRGRGIHRFGRLSLAAGAGPQDRSFGNGDGRALLSTATVPEPRRFRAEHSPRRPRRDRHRARRPGTGQLRSARRRRRAAPAVGPPAAGRARRHDPFRRGRRYRRGPRQRPLHLHYSPAARSCSARWRSETSNRGSTAPASRGCTAATSSTSTAWSA